MSKNEVSMTLFVTKDLRERVGYIAKKTRTSLSQIMRDALGDKLDYMEAKLQITEERVATIKDKKRNERTLNKERRNSTNLLAPERRSLAPEPIPSNVLPEPVAEIDPLEEIYSKHGELIAESINKSPLEKRIVLHEAIAAIRRRSPLTHPPEDIIIRRLEKEVVRVLDEKNPKPSPVDEEPSTIVDLENVKSLGDLE